jgi:hypothetical protein
MQSIVRYDVWQFFLGQSRIANATINQIKRRALTAVTPLVISRECN